MKKALTTVVKYASNSSYFEQLKKARIEKEIDALRILQNEDDVTKYEKYESSLLSRIAAILILESEAKTKVKEDEKE